MPVIASDVSSIITADGAVILDTPHGQMTTLNETGAFVWEGLHQGRSVDAIILELSKQTQVDRMQVERDVNEFLRDLRSRELVTG